MTSSQGNRVLYTAVKRFDRESADWSRFVGWSGLTHLAEVVSLDIMLCPTAFKDLTAEDWEHNVPEDFKTDLFVDLDHVLRRVDTAAFHVLGLLEDPSDDDVAAFRDPRFAFCGFDIVDHQFGVSLLVNCGPHERAFSQRELSRLGLLADLARASDVRDALVREYPDNEHARDGKIWALWRWTGPRDEKK